MRRGGIHAAQDYGQLIIEVAGRCGGDDVGAIDSNDSFHNSIVMAGTKRGGFRKSLSHLESVE